MKADFGGFLFSRCIGEDWDVDCSGETLDMVCGGWDGADETGVACFEEVFRFVGVDSWCWTRVSL